jgi:hypothetical protein
LTSKRQRSRLQEGRHGGASAQRVGTQRVGCIRQAPCAPAASPRLYSFARVRQPRNGVQRPQRPAATAAASREHRAWNERTKGTKGASMHMPRGQTQRGGAGRESKTACQPYTRPDSITNGRTSEAPGGWQNIDRGEGGETEEQARSESVREREGGLATRCGGPLGLSYTMRRI